MAKWFNNKTWCERVFNPFSWKLELRKLLWGHKLFAALYLQSANDSLLENKSRQHCPMFTLYRRSCSRYLVG